MHTVRILKKERINHNVIRFLIEKPENYKFNPGQAVRIAIPEFKEQTRPMTIANTPKENYLEFFIKIYEDHNAITKKIKELKENDELLLTNPFGTISYKGPGIFLAGGTGITPFLSIFRSLDKEELEKNKLYFSNRTKEDILQKEEIENLLKEKAKFILTRESSQRIDKDFLKNIVNKEQFFYVCGPWDFTIQTKKNLDELGVKPEKFVFEI